ncbi:PspC domain-containing protein [Paenibacillus thailandensis]|uniref:PspC domain-containing protein n=1 Tax=Paenibacillus thailandensis TaxID=393250 RepID=A0ABW5R3Z0_9BACL
MKKLYRSRRKKMLFGICGGLSDMLNIDVTLLRILLIVLALFTSGAAILAYILAGIVIPKEPDYFSGYGPGGYNGGYGNYGGGYNQYGTGGGYYGKGGHGPGYGHGPEFGHGPNYGGAYKNPPFGGETPQSTGNFDSMMDDLEKKALRKEIEELKAKLAKYEKGEF